MLMKENSEKLWKTIPKYGINVYSYKNNHWTYYARFE